MGVFVFILVVIAFIIFVRSRKGGAGGAAQGGSTTQRFVNQADAVSLSSYVVLDVETTGLDQKKDRIIEIAALKVENGEEVEHYRTFVDPGRKHRNLSPKIIELTGITPATLEGAKPYEEMAKEIASFLADLPMVAHNSDFDANFVREALNLAGITKKIVHIDTVALAKKAFPNLGSYKLARLIPILGLADHQQTHRAMDDVRCTKNLFVKCSAMIRAQNSLFGETKEIDAILEKKRNIKTPVDLFEAYSSTAEVLGRAFAKDPSGAETLFEGKEKFLESKFAKEITGMMKAQYEKERVAIQKLKTRRGINNHIEKFLAPYLANEDKLTASQVKALKKYERELLALRDTIAPEE